MSDYNTHFFPPRGAGFRGGQETKEKGWEKNMNYREREAITEIRGLEKERRDEKHLQLQREKRERSLGRRTLCFVTMPLVSVHREHPTLTWCL